QGKRVGIVAGYAYGDEVAQAKNTIFVKGPNDQANLDKLLQGGLDYILVDELNIQHLLADQGADIKANLDVGHVPMMKRTLHFAVRKDLPNAAAIINAFNSKLKLLLADGTYNRILQLSWIRADVDGDGKLELIPSGRHIGTSAPTDNYTLFTPDKADP